MNNVGPINLWDIADPVGSFIAEYLFEDKMDSSCYPYFVSVMCTLNPVPDTFFFFFFKYHHLKCAYVNDFSNVICK